MMYRPLFFFDLASTKFIPALYKSIGIRGVKPELCADGKRVVCNVITDGANPQFFSAYLIDLEGHAVCVADAHIDRLDELRDVSKSFADQHHWDYQDFTTKKHDVHIYAIVRVKVPGIEATTHQVAIKKAQDSVDLHALFSNITSAEYAEGIESFRVDEVGDEDFSKSQMYDGNTYESLMPNHPGLQFPGRLAVASGC